jgi:hypothetical protein
MPTYIHELEGWPRFHRSGEGLAKQLAAVRRRQGRLLGPMEVTKTSADTALRDINDLVARGILVRMGRAGAARAIR